jgi:hypothetical protein
LVAAPAAIVAIAWFSWTEVQGIHGAIRAWQTFAIRFASATTAILSNIAIIIAGYTCLIQSIIPLSTIKAAEVLVERNSS